MYHTRRDWIETLEDMQKQMEQFLQHVMAQKRPVAILVPEVWEPRVDVYEAGDNIVVLVELAGVAQHEVEINVDKNVLTLQGHRKDRGPAERVYYQMEISSGPFKRVIELPCAVNPEEARAAYDRGFLEITLPKSKVPRSQRVRVSTV